MVCRAASAQNANDTLPALQARLAAIIDDPRFAQAAWGAKVVSLDSGQTVFERNSEKLLKPASNNKLYTAALALDRLGPDFRIRTSFYAAAKPDGDGAIHGDLIVYGRGDPTFSARFNGGDYKKALQPAVDALVTVGVKHIDGDLIGDESFFRGAPYGTDWTWDDLQEYYGAPASALSYQDNVIDLMFKPGKAEGEPCEIITTPETTILTFGNRTHTLPANRIRGHVRLYRPVGEGTAYVWDGVPLGSRGEAGSVSVPKPALWFVTMLKQELSQHGVAISGGVRQEDWLSRETAPLAISNLVEIAYVQSRPLAEIVKSTLKPSQNLYAQLLLLQVGVHADIQGHDTERSGIAEMQSFLGSANVARGSAQLEEGSGLSRGTLVTPSATVQLLVFMNHHRSRDAFFDGLSIAGVDGTLRNRMKGTVAAGNLRAKTGSLGGVDTLSGYVTTAGKDHLAFSLMLNNFRDETGGRAALDSLGIELAKFQGKLP